MVDHNPPLKNNPHTAIQEVLEFWFGAILQGSSMTARHGRLWFGKDPQVDRQIAERFGSLVESAASGTLESWGATPEGRLALLILLDQFPRNMFRGTPRSFAFDGLARGICLEGMALGQDRRLNLLQQVFFYLPLEHAEDLQLQEQSVTAFARLLEEAPAAWRESFSEFHRYAVKHRDIVARFGRFPHRNAILGRTSSDEELAFLQEPGSSF